MVFANFFAGLAVAWALAGDPFTYEYAGQTDGSGNAWIVVVNNEDMKDVEITIAGDGKTVTRSPGNLKQGSRYKVSWKQKNGQARYQLDINARRKEGDVSGSFAFEVIKTKAAGKIGKLKVRSTREDIVKRHKAEFETTFQLARYDYKIYDSDGEIAAAGSKEDVDIAPGGRFTVTWPASEVFMIFVRGEDEFGRFTEYKLVPWSVEIPHTEINFDSGKWDVKNDESGKLDDAVAVAFHELLALDKVSEAVQANLTPQLYIVGYTDTVGNAGKNKKLSNSRAKQIAEYFYDKGFWAEIYYAGMGERGLRVKTDDGVDEVRNRRAMYLIGLQKPGSGGQIPGNWKRLSGARSMPMGFSAPELPEEWKNYREKRRAEAESGSGGEATDSDVAIDDNPGADLSG
ncbi:MAG: OmpA family protein, partial [Nannocystaceae bacterium]|nr:OmpA family protein [Nannocystaceae bacterium]